MIMDRIALVLAIVGGINWGSVGLFRFDIVAWLFGGQTATVSRVIYTLVGLSALCAYRCCSAATPSPTTASEISEHCKHRRGCYGRGGVFNINARGACGRGCSSRW